MKVYIVVLHDRDDFDDILGVFASRELAEARQRVERRGDIYEHEVIAE